MNRRDVCPWSMISEHVASSQPVAFKFKVESQVIWTVDKVLLLSKITRKKIYVKSYEKKIGTV